jgi:thioredoxin reductase (NADPH)
LVTGVKKVPAGHFEITTDDGTVRETRAVIVATGASPKHLGLPNEKQLIGRGLTSCATCDGAFYRNVPVCVIGGGDSACEEASFLTKFASTVYLIHRRDSLRASKIMADRALANPKIKPVWNSTVIEYLTDEKGEMRAAKLQNLLTKEETDLDVKCVFVAIGHVPNARFLGDLVDVDENGYILQTRGTLTKTEGLFAAGDVADHVYRQAITAAGQGCAAALEAERYLAVQGVH